LKGQLEYLVGLQRGMEAVVGKREAREAVRKAVMELQAKEEQGR